MTYQWWHDMWKEVDDGASVRRVNGPDDVLHTSDRWRLRETVNGPLGDVDVSTVFLGLDHRFSSEGEPILYETMIFGGPHDQDQWRYTSRAEALKGHEKAKILAANGERRSGKDRRS